MRGYRSLVAALASSSLREPAGFFFSLVFAPALVVILGIIFGNDPTPEFGGVGYLDKTLPAFGSVVLAIIGVMIVPQQQLILRESGALTRLRVTPLRPITFIAADLSVNFVVGLVGMLLALGLGILAFGVEPPRQPLAVLAACALGLASFLALGYALAALYPSSGAALGIGNVLIGLMLTSGAFVPLEAMPAGIQSVMGFSPVHHFVELVRRLWQGQGWSTLLTPTLVLVGLGLVAGAFGAWRFRWHSA